MLIRKKEESNSLSPVCISGIKKADMSVCFMSKRGMEMYYVLLEGMEFHHSSKLSSTNKNKREAYVCDEEGRKYIFMLRF